MIIFIILLLFYLICLYKRKTRTKDDRDGLLIYWLTYYIIFLTWFVKQSRQNKLIALVIVLSIPQLRLPFLFVTSIPLLFSCNSYSKISNLCNNIFNTTLDIKINRERLPDQPTIFICNYSANYIGYLSTTILKPNTCLIVNKCSYKYTKHLFGENNIICVDVDSTGNTEHVRNEIHIQLEKGNNVLAFVEKQSYTRKNLFSVTDSLKKGMFVIASQLDATITPVVLDHIHHSHGIITNTRFNIYVDETRRVSLANIENEMIKVKTLFRRKLNNFYINEI
jgi:hypothetical protein